MSDLDNLRPEVRGALEVIAGEAVCTCHEAYTSRGMKDPACNHDLKGYVDTIRAELLRLASTEAELAALKARIAEAQKCSVVALCGGGASLSHEPYDSLIGHRVALVKVGNELTGEHADSMEEWARRKVEE